MKVDEIIDLENGKSYLLLLDSVIDGAKFFLAVGLNEVEEPNNDYIILKEITENNETYIQKVTILDTNSMKASSEYMNISLENIERINELVGKLEIKELLKSVKVENNNLVIEYEYYPIEDILISNNAILFACIDNLENIVYTATNKKTFYTEKVENQYQTIYDENRENFTINKNDFVNYTGIDISDLKEYIRKEV